MFSPSCFRSVLSCTKRVKTSPALLRSFVTSHPDTPVENATCAPKEQVTYQFKGSEILPDKEITLAGPKEWDERLQAYKTTFRLPKNVQAVYMKPFKRKAEYGLPVCNLQLRSYSARHVEFFADFALRAAYYLNIPAAGPIPLPRMIERWTVIRSPFIHKKSKENFERITCRRLIQLQDAHPETVQVWLAFLRKHAFHGVGMKANLWEHTNLDVGKEMDEAGKTLEKTLDAEFAHFGAKKGAEFSESVIDMMERESQTRTGAPLTDLRKGPEAAKPVPQWRRHSSTSTSGSAAPVDKAVIFSGIQPTGVPHLGNYLGALRAWVDLQKNSAPGTKLIYSIVDLHALTIPKDASQLRRWRKQALAVLLAVGIEPEKATIFYQSAVPAHSELMWILSTNASMGYLSRMTQWKSKLQLPEGSTLEDSAARARLKLGLFSYPVLQAADVLVHRANYIPVGEDQKQHIEFAREVAKGFNHLYGNILTVPEALISPAKRVMSLKQPLLKMSKSHADARSMVLLTDTPEEIRSKVKTALTDSQNSITYDPQHRPGVSNLLEMLSHLESIEVGTGGSGRSASEIAQEYSSASLRVLKEDVADRLVKLLSPIRERYVMLMEGEEGRGDEGGKIDAVASKGAVEAAQNAEVTMRAVRRAVGLL
ncbi:Tryptophan--tRNA ligase, mitochondrial [Myotisia sp. PD_48]|nr:Tryptophan--tRNA ligase, mitochondrial [Myotisia sp. PD_48]